MSGFVRVLSGGGRKNLGGKVLTKPRQNLDIDIDIDNDIDIDIEIILFPKVNNIFSHFVPSQGGSNRGLDLV